MFRRSSRSWSLLLVVAGLLLAACNVVAPPSKPSVVIDTPPSGSQFHDGDTVSVQSTSTDPTGITRVDLLVDGNVVRSDTPPVLQASFSVVQTWKATAGSHTIAVRAFNATNVESGPAAVAVAVAPGAIAGAPTAGITPTLSPAPTAAPTAPPAAPTSPTAAPAACVNNSAFVVDVTVPDGTLFEPGQPFNKIWRVRNSGTCGWATGYTFLFTGGTAMHTVRAIGVPPTPPGATADLLIPMTAPNVPGSFTSVWRLRSPGGTIFGATLFAAIRVPAPQPAPSATPVPTPACTGTPIITSFTGSPTVITPGQTATLSFGLVANADRAEIDNGIGGVPTPGNVTVQPSVTTTYTLTGRCGSTTAISQVTIVVTSALVRCAIFGESGEAIKAGNTFSASQALRVGVDGSNQSHRAFFSFDLSGLAGKTIDVANLSIAAPSTQGNPFSLGPLIVESVQYSPPVDGADYGLASSPVLSTSTGPAGQFSIVGPVQNAASSNRTRFQLRLRFQTESSNTANLLTWPSNNDVCLSLAFH